MMYNNYDYKARITRALDKVISIGDLDKVQKREIKYWASVYQVEYIDLLDAVNDERDYLSKCTDDSLFNFKVF